MATNKITTTIRESSSNISKNYSRFEFPTRKNAITDDYEVSSEALGDGINGKVLKCQHRRTKQKCALKILKDSDIARREVMTHKKACENCQYIVQIIDVYVRVLIDLVTISSYTNSLRISGKYVWVESMSVDRHGTVKTFFSLVDAFGCSSSMEGGELYERITQRKTKPYTERDAANYILMIVRAVAHLHAMDMAHRDLKLENLLFTSKENDAILKLTDFGFAKEGNNQLQPLTTPCYTPYYVAPEILSRTKYDKACDIWSMGVIMYILLCGYPPFYSSHGNSLTDSMKRKIKAGEYQFPKAEWQNVSEEAKSTIQRMLTVNPAERITITEILNCSWLMEPASDTPIDMSSLDDADNWNQIQAEFNSANNVQRRADDDIQLDIQGPEASNVVKKRAAKKRLAEKNE